MGIQLSNFADPALAGQFRTADETFATIERMIHVLVGFKTSFSDRAAADFLYQLLIS